MNVLANIIDGVRTDLRARMAEVSLEALRCRAKSRGPRMTPEDVGAALRGTDLVRLIIEVKRGSPARGRLASIERPGVLVAEYAAGGAAAISVLTEPRHVGGSLDDLRAVRESVSVPLLHKDFVRRTRTGHCVRPDIRWTPSGDARRGPRCDAAAGRRENVT